ncbi:MAG: gliding motility-associated C-terminal domain-containing protein [Sphingobacteriia bacterium]|nr:MAG: gliding motility-associated C-terminal domain-containing protein [Sphingobacteriia bacterium]
MLANISLTAPIGYEISTSENGIFNNSIELSPINGMLSNTTVFVRFITSTVGNYSGNIVVNSAGATSQNIAVSGTVNPLPIVAAITGTQQVCFQSTTPFTNTTTGGVWSSSNTTVATINTAGLITGTQSGIATISYTVTNASGCNTTVARDITVNALPQVTAIASPALVLKGLSTQLSATGNAASYVWSPAANLSTPTQANTTARITDNTTFIVTATTAQGCIATASVLVAIKPDVIFVEPTNVFTPNGDGINDRFVIKNLDQYPNNKLQIFDRNGKVVYEQNNYANTWDGTVNGKILTKDTYFFVLTIKGQIVKRGTFTVLR